MSLRSPVDVIHAVPFLLGFTPPAESIVLVGLRGNTVAVTARLDLADGPAGFHQTCDTVAARAGDALLILYSEQAAPQWLVEQAGQFKDAMHVRTGRWFSLICENPTCCPADGTALPDPGSSVVAAAGVLAGLAPMASRDDVLASVRPANVTAAATAAALALSSIPARDEEWLAMEAQVTGEAAAILPFAQRYLDIARHSPQDATACAPWFLYAWACWRMGDELRVQAALDNIRAIDPTYSAADLLAHAVAISSDPRTTPSLASLIA